MARERERELKSLVELTAQAVGEWHVQRKSHSGTAGMGRAERAIQHLITGEVETANQFALEIIAKVPPPCPWTELAHLVRRVKDAFDKLAE